MIDAHVTLVVRVIRMVTARRQGLLGGVIVDDPDDLPGGPEQERMATFLSMPLRGHGGRVVGVQGISATDYPQTLSVTTVGAFDPSIVDMRTMLIIGSSQTQWYTGSAAGDTTEDRVFTPRQYPG